jgi:hypothetical protein
LRFLAQFRAKPDVFAKELPGCDVRKAGRVPKDRRLSALACARQAEQDYVHGITGTKEQGNKAQVL